MALQEWSAGLQGSPYGEDYVTFLTELDRRLPGMPTAVRGVIVDFRAELGRAGVLLISGLPVPNRPPPTPVQAFVEIRRPVGVEPMVLGVGRLLGEPVGFADWHGGDRLQNMYPLPGEVAKQNASNAVYLEMHTETAFRPDTPHAVVLFALRGDSRALTLFCDAARALAELPATDRRLLAEPRYAFEVPNGAVTKPKPVVVTTDRGPRINYAEALIGVDPAAYRALAAFRAAIDRHLCSIALVPGDMVVVDNLHVVHGRTAYRPGYGGTDRWLQRCLVRCPEVPGSDAPVAQIQQAHRAHSADDVRG